MDNPLIADCFKSLDYYRDNRLTYYNKISKVRPEGLSKYTGKYFKLSMEELCSDIGEGEYDSCRLKEIFDGKKETIQLLEKVLRKCINKPHPSGKANKVKGSFEIEQISTAHIEWTTKYCIGDIYQILKQMVLGDSMMWFLYHRIHEYEKSRILDHVCELDNLEVQIERFDLLESKRETHYNQTQLDNVEKSLTIMKEKEQSIIKEKQWIEKEKKAIQQQKETMSVMNKHYKEKNDAGIKTLNSYKQKLIEVSMKLNENNDINGCNQLINMGLFEIINELNHLDM